MSPLLWIVVLMKIVLSQNACLWGSHNKDVINGPYVFQGDYEGAPWFKKQQAGYIHHMWRRSTESTFRYLITSQSPSEYNPTFSFLTLVAYCVIDNNNILYPWQCGTNQWNVSTAATYLGEYKIDPNVYCQMGPCPQWDCDAITTDIHSNGCDAIFSEKVASNAWSNHNGDTFLYFNPSGFNWICGNELLYTSNTPPRVLVFAYSEKKWIDATKGDNVTMNFIQPQNDYNQLQVIQCLITKEPTVYPTYIPSTIPTMFPIADPTKTVSLHITVKPISTNTIIKSTTSVTTTTIDRDENVETKNTRDWLLFALIFVAASLLAIICCIGFYFIHKSNVTIIESTVKMSEIHASVAEGHPFWKQNRTDLHREDDLEIIADIDENGTTGDNNNHVEQGNIATLCEEETEDDDILQAVNTINVMVYDVSVAEGHQLEQNRTDLLGEEESEFIADIGENDNNNDVEQGDVAKECDEQSEGDDILPGINTINYVT